MKRQLKFLALALGFVVLLVGSLIAYNLLKEGNTPQVLAPAQQSAAADEPASNPKSEPENAPESEPQSAAQPEPTKAPDFDATDAEGNPVKLSDYFGKPIVLNFWATWCGYCKQEMPAFDKVYGELGEDVAFLMVDMVDGSSETKEKGAAFIADEGFTFPVLFDEGQSAAYAYGVSSLPTTYFINAEGDLVTGARGAIDEETLRYGISLIMEE